MYLSEKLQRSTRSGQGVRGCGQNPMFDLDDAINTNLTQKEYELRRRLNLSSDISPWRKPDGSRLDNGLGTVGQELRNRLQDPLTCINQRTGPFCAYATLLVTLAVAKPELYINLVGDLFIQGFSDVGDRRLQPGVCRYFYDETKPDRVDFVDWMTMSSLPSGCPCFNPDADEDEVDRGAGLCCIDNIGPLLFPEVLAADMHFDVRVPNGTEWKAVKDSAAYNDTFVLITMFSPSSQQAWTHFSQQSPRSGNHMVLLASVKDDTVCKTWTWAKVHNYDCAQLQKTVTNVWALDFSESSIRAQNRVKKLKDIILSKEDEPHDRLDFVP